MDRLPVMVTIHATVAINDRTKATPLMSVALPSTEGIDDVIAAGLQMIATHLEAGEYSIAATIKDNPEA